MSHCFIKKRKEEIFSAMELDERHDYSTLATLYVQKNMKKYQKQKVKNI